MERIDNYRYIARFILEAKTPLFIGSGDSSLMTDALVQKDTNGLPVIPGTSLAGVLRHALEQRIELPTIFGGNKNNNEKFGSKLKVSSGHLILGQQLVSEGIIQNMDDKWMHYFSNLPKRAHVRINHKGTADKENNGLFDNEAIYKGVRFFFELELRGQATDQDEWNELMKIVQSPTFRIGSGSRNGYGLMQVVASYQRIFDLENKHDFEGYLNWNPSFNNSSVQLNPSTENLQKSDGYVRYQLELTPDSFFIFSAGTGDEEADNAPVKELVVIYRNGDMEFTEHTVIPGSSIKGALAHRTAFYYNKINNNFSDEIESSAIEQHVGINNKAVAALFGKAGKGVSEPSAGKVYINDVYFSEEETNPDKLFNHVAIDRFTGGAIDGALFSEKVTSLKDGLLTISIDVEESAFDDHSIKNAFETALMDVAKGLLPLGGMTTKGHGLFTGKVIKNSETLFEY
jgi:CRISPR/Cas system CMR subunit Cmr4 (Cas7 group RAMP superfamily)